MTFRRSASGTINGGLPIPKEIDNLNRRCAEDMKSGPLKRAGDITSSNSTKANSEHSCNA